MAVTTDTKPTYEQLAAEVLYLRQELDKLKRLIFGQKRERYVPVEQPSQLNMALAEPPVAPLSAKTEQISYTRRKKNHNHTPHGRNPLPAHLLRKQIVIEPTEDVTGFKKIGEEITEQLEYEPGKLYVNQYVRPKYARPNDDGIIIGALPSRPIEKGIPGPGLLAQILISKYVDHLPLYRQRQQFKRYEVDIAASTIGDWVKASGELLQPLYQRLQELIITVPYLMADETPIPVLDQLKKGSTHLGYYWVYHAPRDRLVLFDYREGRSRAGPNQLLRSFKGYLQTDGYTGYDEIIAREDVISIGCFAHARRYFIEAQPHDPERAEWILTQIQQLYLIERLAREQQLDDQARFQLRQEAAVPLLATIHAWLKEQAKQVLPRSSLGKAIGYMLHQWPRLERYVTDGRLEIDNNLIENLIRPVALGRKNYLFAGSHNGARRAAMVYSLVVTAKLNNVEPFAYLKDVLSRIDDHLHKNLDELLPSQWKPLTNP